MKALVYKGPGEKSWEEVPDPVIQKPTDVIVKMVATTICGTDLHILKGDVPEVEVGRILGHEGIGVITEIGCERHATGRRRQGDLVVREFVRTMFQLSRGTLRPLPRPRRHRRDRLDLRLHDRRHAGRVGSRPVRRELGLQDARDA